MADDEERQRDVGMPVGQRSPHKILNHAVVLVLTCAIVGVE